MWNRREYYRCDSLYSLLIGSSPQDNVYIPSKNTVSMLKGFPKVQAKAIPRRSLALGKNRGYPMENHVSRKAFQTRILYKTLLSLKTSTLRFSNTEGFGGRTIPVLLLHICF
jgi:hypothetical protein